MFCEVFRTDRVKPIAAVDMFEVGRPPTLTAIMRLLVEFAFFTDEQLHAALAWMQDGGPRPKSEAVLRVVEIVEGLRGA